MLSSKGSTSRFVVCAILIAFAFFAFPNSGMSQSPVNPTVSMRVQKMTGLLNLTPVQQNRYAKFLVRRDNDKAMLVQKQKKLSPADMQKLQMELKMKYDGELQQIFTADQFKKLNQEAAKIAKRPPGK